MLPTGEKKVFDSPTSVVITSEAPVSKSSSRKKYVVIAVSCLLAAAIILTAILVGMYLFTQGQKEIIKFAYNQDRDTKEDVSSDPNTNVVQYHVNSKEYEMWVVNDFNRDIQVMKIQSESETNCYVAPLNRTTAMDPSKISAPADLDTTKRNTTYSVTYVSANTPIPDSSFLCKTAREACKGISTYWVYPLCDIPEDSKERRYKRGTVCRTVSWGWGFFTERVCRRT